MAAWYSAAERNTAPAMSEPLDDGHVRLAAALAHGLQAITRSAPFQLVKERGHEPGARRPERVSEGNRATVDVDARRIRVQVALPGEHHRGEGFVDLDQIDVGELQSALRQRVLRRRNGRSQNPDGIRTANREVGNARARLELVAP